MLDLHYSGEGWEIVRKYLTQYVPKDHVMWPMFMESSKVPGKCLVRMKIDELYRDVSVDVHLCVYVVFIFICHSIFTALFPT